jgi:prevent-host-death family protein
VNMKTMPTEQARNHMRDLLDEAIAGNPVVLTRYGKAVAVVVPASFFTIGHDIPADEHQAQPV